MSWLSHRPPLNLAPIQHAARLRPCPRTGGCPTSRLEALSNRCRGRWQVSAASASDRSTDATTASAQPARTVSQLRKATAILENAITTAVVDFSRRDEPQASVSTQFVIVTEQMPLDRAAAEGWLSKLIPPSDLDELLGLRSLLALTITDAAKLLIVCPAIRNLSRQELCGRLMALRVALPDVDVPAIVRKKPMLLLDQDAPSKAQRALRRLKALMPAYDVERLLSESSETWYNFANML